MRCSIEQGERREKGQWETDKCSPDHRPARCHAQGSIATLPVGVRGCGPAGFPEDGLLAKRGRAPARPYRIRAVGKALLPEAAGLRQQAPTGGLLVLGFGFFVFPQPSTLGPRPSTHDKASCSGFCR
jgi:hypothetical protein